MDPSQIEQDVLQKLAPILAQMKDGIAMQAAKTAQAEVDRQFKIYALGAAGLVVAGYFAWRLLK